MDSSEIRARQRKARGRLRRPATPHARRFLQSYGNRGWRDLLAATTGTLQDAAVCDGGVPLGISRAARRNGVRNRTREKRTAGNQGLFRRIPRGIESAPPADRRASHEGESEGSRRGAN